MTNCLLEVLAQPDSHSKSITSQWVTGLSQTQSGGVETGTGSGTRNDSIVSVRLNQWPRLTGWDDLALWVGHSHSLSLWVWPNIVTIFCDFSKERLKEWLSHTHSVSHWQTAESLIDWQRLVFTSTFRSGLALNFNRTSSQWFNHTVNYLLSHLLRQTHRHSMIHRHWITIRTHVHLSILWVCLTPLCDLLLDDWLSRVT